MRWSQAACARSTYIHTYSRTKMHVRITCDRPDLFVYEKRKKEITLLEARTTCQFKLQAVEVEKTRKHDILTNELSLIYKCGVKILPDVVTWNGRVKRHHRTHMSCVKSAIC